MTALSPLTNGRSLIVMTLPLLYEGTILLNNKKFMFGLGPTEIIIFAAILVLLFGSKKIADLARSVAEAVKILRGSFSDEKDKTDKKS